MKRLKRTAAAFVLTLAVILLSTGGLYAQGLSGESTNSTTVVALVSYPQQYDGKTVTIEGEAVGELLGRGDATWVNVGDQGMAIGVLAPTAQARAISKLGNYAVTGDRVRITGLFHVGGSSQQGETFLEAQSIAVIAKGSARSHGIDPARVVLAVSLLAMGVAAVRFAATKHGWPAKSF